MGAVADPARGILVAHQPAYLPWCGYFSRLLDVPQMIILDHVQFSERGYQHRNRILDRTGTLRWLTVPVRRRFGQPLCDVRIADPEWARRHWRTLTATYGKAPFWPVYADHLGAVFAQQWTTLVDLDLALTRLLLDAFGMSVTLVRSSTVHPAGTKTAMLIDLCSRTGDRVLRVGTGALKYLDRAALHDAGIRVEVATYTHPPYPQNHPGTFIPAVSVIDLLVQQGPAARDILARGCAITPWPTT
ncbi:MULTISPECIES: WbqC family protein [Micromonosporaceae]|uniref:WbqC family protein n=1 Tax=Micromonosporaceae TaxID=28056 RepID=UPI002DD9EF8B|nr:WbqC family protein [Micromonospora sp. NBC_01813]WSA07040.1 WbqC family protein [Micromonospora sp. NBC_01813]